MNHGQSRWTQYLLQIPYVCFHSRHGFVDFTLFPVHPTNILQSYQSQKPYSFVRVPLLKESAGTH